MEAGDHGDRAPVVDLEHRAAAMGVADRLEQGQAASNVGTPTERHLEHAQLVVDGAPEPFGLDAMGSDQLGRLAREGVGLVAVGRALGHRQQLADLGDQRGVGGGGVQIGHAGTSSQGGVTPPRISRR